MRRVISLMLGELNASHLGITAPPGGNAPTTGRLGVRFDAAEYAKSGALRITEILPLGPLALAKDASVGDYLVAVDGRALDRSTNLDELLLHTIGKRLIQQDISTPGREIPIVFPDDIAGDAQREYPGYELASVGQRFIELSQVMGGSEFEFAPEFVDTTSKQYIRWRLRLGTPYLGNLGFTRYWEYRKALVSTAFDTDGGYRITRDFERGNGMNRDLITGFADRPIGSAPAEMVLENVGNDHTSAKDVTTLNSWAAATVAGGQAAAPTITHVVRVAGDNGEGFQTSSPALAEVEPGDNCLTVYPAGQPHPRLGAGTFASRIIDIGNGNDETTATLGCQLLGRVS